jgi:hypothetical protein
MVCLDGRDREKFEKGKEGRIGRTEEERLSGRREREHRMKWDNFANHVSTELETGSSLFNFAKPFKNEQELTREIVRGLRDSFAQSFSVKDKLLLPYHVICRQGDTQEEKLVWKESKPEKWIPFHGVRFVPDILIRPRQDDQNNIIPIEVKLIKHAGSGQGIATAIGQALIYAAKHSKTQAIVFIGIERSIEWGAYELTQTPQSDDEKVYNALENIGIRMILRKVGVQRNRLWKSELDLTGNAVDINSPLDL